MNNDLISRSELMKAVEKEFEGVCVYDVPPSEAVSDIERIIDSIPTIDAEPVRHGRWIPNGNDDMDEGIWHCSECKHEIYTDLSCIEEIQEHGYALHCEHCGAKMDPGVESKMKHSDEIKKGLEYLSTRMKSLLMPSLTSGSSKRNSPNFDC